MTQFHFIDDSGDPGVVLSSGVSTHFILAMVQLPLRMPIEEIAAIRREFHLPPDFEIKHYRTSERQRDAFFTATETVPFRVRIVYIQKERLSALLSGMNGQELTLELLTRLILGTPALDIANDVLIVDGATKAFRQALRSRLSWECRRTARVRPFASILGANSRNEDGLQLADMIAGATRLFLTRNNAKHYRSFAHKVVDLRCER